VLFLLPGLVVGRICRADRAGGRRQDRDSGLWERYACLLLLVRVGWAGASQAGIEELLIRSRALVQNWPGTVRKSYRWPVGRVVRV
jgi:hypothetical protein